jgi:hypothetical protein
MPSSDTYFSKERQPDRSKRGGGRKPSHLRKWIKDDNVGTQDIRLLFSKITSGVKSIDDIKELLKDPKTPPIVIFPLKAMLDDFRKGRLDTFKWLTEYAYGKAVQETRNVNADITSDMTREEREQAINDLLAKRAEAMDEDSEE